MLLFPTLIGETFPVIRRPVFSTIVKKAASGIEIRAGNYSYPLWEWDIPFSWLSQEAAVSDFQTLVGLILNNYGQFGAFLYNDPNDHTTSPVPASPTPSVIATGDGSTTSFQIGRVLGGFFEPVYDINGAVAPKIYLNTTLQTSGYTISATGLVTFTSPPSGGVQVKADFQYYWRVRFSEDNIEFSNFVSQWWEATSIKIQQVRVS